jgi:phage terminase large subunit-like protein
MNPTELNWPPDVPRPLSSPPWTDAPTDGPKVAAWIQKHCRCGEGDRWGQPVRLHTFQKMFLCWLFQLHPTGRRKYRYRTALLEVAKGNGKTGLASWVGAYQLVHQNSAVIPVAAASYDQADLLFGDMRAAIGESPTLAPAFSVFDGEIQLNGSPSRAYKIAAVAGTNDGQRPSTFLADEVHEWVSGKERVHLVISNGCAKRDESMIVNTTTPGWDLHTLAGRMHEYGLKVNSGEINDPETLFVWWGCEPDRYDLDTDDGLLAAVKDANPAADLFLNTANVVARYHQIPRNEFLRYHLACWTSSQDSFLPEGAWSACEQLGGIPASTEVCLGFDGSHTNDSTALVVVSCRTDESVPHIDVAQCWEKPLQAGQDWMVPIVDVEDAIRKACERWNVRWIVADKFGYGHSLQILKNEGLPVMDMPQNDANMMPATRGFWDGVMNHDLTHSGDLRLKRHMGNARVKIGARGMKISKDARNSPRKIDLAVAAVMAYDLATRPPENATYSILESIY